MGIQNKDGALYFATGIDNSGLYSGRNEAMGIIKAMAGEITAFDVFGGIGISAGIAFAQAAKGAYEFEKQFQQSMKEVATLSSGIKGSLTDYMNQVMEITRDIPVLANDAAKALYQIVSAGHDGANGMKVLEVSAKAAIGGVTDTATAADGITTLLNAYKLDVSEAEKISDQLFTTVKLGKTSFGELGKSIAQVAPIAAAYGVEIDQVLAAVATLTKQGTPTAQAMTQIRASIIAVSKVLGDGAFDNRTYQEALAEVARQAGGSESKLRELVPEVEAVNAVLGLTGINVKEAAGHLEEMQNATGAAEAAFKEMASSAENQMKLLGNNITAALRPLGQEILKEISAAAQSMNEAFADGSAQEALKNIGALIVVVTTALAGYKGSILAVSTAKQVYATVTAIVNKQRAIEAANLVLTKGMYAIEATMIAKNMTARILLTKALKAQTIAQLKNAAAMLTNPYVLAAAAFAGLGYAIYKVATAETAAEKATRKHREEQERFQSVLNERKQRIDELIRVIQDETETEYAQIKAYEELQKISPALTAAYSRQKIETLQTANAQKILNREFEKLNYNHIISEVNRINKAMKTYQQQSGLSGKALENKSHYQSLKKELNKYKEELEEYKRLKKQAEEAAKPVEARLLEAKSSREQIVQEYNAAKLTLEVEQRKIKESGFGVIPIWVQIRFDKAKSDFDNIDKMISGVLQTQDEIHNKSFWTKQKDDATKALDSIASSQKKLMDAGNFKGIDSAVVKSYKENAKKLKEAEKELEVYDSSSKRDDKGKKLREEQEKYKLLLDKQGREQQRMKEDSVNELEQLEINKLKESSEKVLKQRELNHRLELQAIEREAEDKKLQEIEKARSAFEANPENKKKTFNASVFINSESTKKLFASFDNIAKEAAATANTKYNRGDDLSDLLNQYQDYTDQRLAIERKFNEDIATLQEQRKQAVKNGDTEQVEQIDRSIAQATKNKGMELMGLDYDKLKESPEYVRAFENLKETSSETLNSLLTQLENAKQTAAQVLSPDQLREYTTTIQEIMDELDSRNPFQALADRQKELAEAEEALAKAKAQLDAVNSGAKIVTGVKNSKYNDKTGKIESEQTYLSATQALVNYNKAKDKAVKADAKVQAAEKKVSNVIDDLSNSIKNVGSSVGGQAGEIIGLIGDIGTFAMSAMSGIETASQTASAAVKAVESASVILMIISTAIQIATKISNMFSKDKEKEMEKYVGQLNAMIDIYERIIEKQKESIRFGYGFSAITSAKKAMEELNNKTEQYRKIAQSAGASKDSLSRDYRDRFLEMLHDVKPISFNLKPSSLKSLDTGDLSKFTAKQLLYFRDNYKDIWSALNEEQRNALQAIIDAEEESKEIVDAWKESITGISYDNLYSEFIDTLSDMDSSAEDMANNFGEYLRKSILASMVANEFQDKIDNLYEMWVNAGDEKSEGGTNITEDEAKKIQERQKELAEAMTKRREEIEKTYGFDSSTSSQDSTKKGFENMSQDSADELNGRFTALQIAGETSKEQLILQTGIQQIMAQRLESIYNFNYSSMTEMRDIIFEVMDILSDMKKDTAHLYFIRESLNKIESNTKGLTSR